MGHIETENTNNLLAVQFPALVISPDDMEMTIAKVCINVIFKIESILSVIYRPGGGLKFIAFNINLIQLWTVASGSTGTSSSQA